MDLAPSIKYSVSITGIISTVSAYISLTKPTIQLLLLVTAFSAIAVEGTLLGTPWKIVELSILFAFAGGSAKAFNQILERNLDQSMSRTSNRPIPSKRVSPEYAFIFACALALISIILLWFRANPLTSILTLTTIAFYGVIYTLYLKPLTRWNTVIGGITGAMAPITAWVSTGSELTWTPVLMGAIVFFWSPPHFYSLSLYYKKDYENGDVKVMTKSSSEARIWQQIMLYTVVTVGLSGLFYFYMNSLLFIASMAVIGILYIFITAILSKKKSPKSSYRLFIISILYLFLLFAIITADALGV